MFEIASLAFATFFATIGPIDIAAVFAALTANDSQQRRQSVALRATLVATVILLIFALTGQTLLSSFGITLPALSTAGGILLLLIGIDMVLPETLAPPALPAMNNKRLNKKQILLFFHWPPLS